MLSPAKMKLPLLCLGLTLVCAHKEGNPDAVRSNFDISKVGAVENSDFGFWGVVWRIVKQGDPPGGQQFLDILGKRGDFRP